MPHYSPRYFSLVSPLTLVAVGLVNSLTPLTSFAGVDPVIHEEAWLLEASIPFTNPMSALINPDDRMIYLGKREGGIYRTDYAGANELLFNSNNVAGLAYDPLTQAMFFSEDFPGRIHRVNVDANGIATSQQWITGFHSGDDDPTGIAAVPLNYSGDIFAPGTMASLDRGFNGPNGVWSWSSATIENELLIHGDDSTLSDPIDIAINPNTVVIADTAGGMKTLNEDGSVSAITTTDVEFTNVQGVVFDTRTDDLLVLDIDLDAIYRVNIQSGASSLIADQLGTSTSNANWGGLNIYDNGTSQFLIISSTDTDRVHIFSTTPPCSDADLSGPFGQLNFFDVAEFLEAYAANDLAVDFTGDGMLNFFDVAGFLDAYLSGCP